MLEAPSIALTGASGLIGRAARLSLQAQGHPVVRAVRGRAGSGEISWDPDRGLSDPEAWENLDAVIHLAGASLAGYWTAAHKAAIRTSRVDATRKLCLALTQLRNPPHCLICASAIGWYGDTGEGWAEEGDPPGSGFLAELVRDWEGASRLAQEAGIRVVHLRFGLVLSAQGGVLPRMLAPFRLGLGGPMGSGQQWMSFIGIEDLMRILQFALLDSKLEGPVNAVLPEPMRNKDFARLLGRILHRPAMLPLPAWAIRRLLGEMGEQLLLASSRIRPRLLMDRGFSFVCPSPESALRQILSEPS